MGHNKMGFHLSLYIYIYIYICVCVYYDSKIFLIILLFIIVLYNTVVMGSY